MTRFVCVHGHFYQPPREDPWTGRVEREASAAPFHDWNERITAECYGPNADNYSRMSFNFGPTLLSWLDREARPVLEAILAADRESRERFSGHGSALAQAYGHMILPLARPRDKRTQVYWGIRDFEHRFGRSPEGMWLPETAVDTETLEVLAELGIRFTILAPHQLLQWRESGHEGWQVAVDGFDTRRPYEARLPSGARIALFFYDGSASPAIAFGGMAGGAENLARILLDRFTGGGDPQIVSVATDGETYGHHFRGGDRVLSGLLDRIEAEGGVRLTNYARIPRATPSPPRGPDPRNELLELHARGRPLEGELRLHHGGASRLEPGVAGAAAAGARLSSRRARRALRGEWRKALPRPLVGARRFDRARSRPAAPARRPFSRATRAGVSTRKRLRGRSISSRWSGAR